MDTFIEETRRGYQFDDKKEFGTHALATLRMAAADICFLLNRGYTIRSAVTFTGNHYLLTARQRLALARSLASEKQLSNREEHELPEGPLPQCICIDGFNTIITLETALSGSLLLYCQDGTIRDLAGLHGTYRIIDKTPPAIRLIFTSLRESGAEKTVIYLDRQISNSGRLKELIKKTAAEEMFSVSVELVPDVDTRLTDKDCVVSSDSVVLDRCRTWYNLNRRIIRQYIPGTWGIKLP